jgi:hypothetical protein
MKFMAIGTHPPVTQEAPGPEHDDVRANVEFIQARVADGTYDSAHIMVGGGRLIIANAESEEIVRSSLTTPPDHPLRSWEITQLLDFDEVMTAYLKG